VRTVILCGGLGTRLREETEYRPKPMVEIGGRPILWHIMKSYAHYGFTDFVLCLGYRGQMIKEYFLNYQAVNNDFTLCLGRPDSVAYHGRHTEQDLTVTLADTGLNTMTGGRVKRVAGYVRDATFMLTYGDGLADVDLNRVLEFHRQHGRLATITSVRPVSRFGVLQTDDSGSVLEFAEKPNTEGWINAGFMVLEPGVLDYISADDCALEQEPLERLARDGQLMTYRHEGFFFAMDTYREYLHLNQLWDEGRAPWRIWT
jgi:glucose-1-phosphate cytidylyltransferase